MLGLPSILSLFRKDYDTLNNTIAQILDTIYHRTLKLLKIAFWRANNTILPSFTQLANWTSLRYVTSLYTYK